VHGRFFRRDLRTLWHSDALRTLERDFNGRCQLFFLADHEGKTVDDCIALALGGNQAYGDVLTNDKDIVLFFTPMWAAHWQDLPDDYSLLKHVRFKKIAKVDTGLAYEPDFEPNCTKCAERLAHALNGVLRPHFI